MQLFLMSIEHEQRPHRDDQNKSDSPSPMTRRGFLRKVAQGVAEGAIAAAGLEKISQAAEALENHAAYTEALQSYQNHIERIEAPIQRSREYNVPIYWTAIFGGYGRIEAYEKTITQAESVNRFSGPAWREDFPVIQRLSGAF